MPSFPVRRRVMGSWVSTSRCCACSPIQTGISGIRSAWLTPARSNLPTGKTWRPNWATAKRYSSIFPPPGATTAHATIYTPRTELPFVGHPTVGRVVVAARRRYADQHAAGAGRHRAGELRGRPHGYQRTHGMGSRIRHPRPRFARRACRRRPRRFSRRHRALPVDLDRSVRRITACADVRLQSRCTRRRSDRVGGDADHRLSQPRPHHHPGQGISDRNHLEPRGWVGVAGRVVNDGVRQ